MLPLFIGLPLIILFIIVKFLVSAHDEAGRHKLYAEYLELLKKVSPEKYEAMSEHDLFEVKLDRLFYDDPREYNRLLKSEIENLRKLAQ